MVKLKCHITSIFFTVKSYRNAYLLSEELGLGFVSSAAEGHHDDQKAGEANKWRKAEGTGFVQLKEEKADRDIICFPVPKC